MAEDRTAARVRDRVFPGLAPTPTGGLDLGIPSEPWMADALCREVDAGDMWFPEKGGSTAEAKRICALCAVREPCLAYALASGERFGIWGGASERERRRLQRGAA